MTSAVIQYQIDKEMRRFMQNAKLLQRVSYVLSNMEFGGNGRHKTNETTVVLSLSREEIENISGDFKYAEDIKTTGRK
jgi:hypothetical protein